MQSSYQLCHPKRTQVMKGVFHFHYLLLVRTRQIWTLLCRIALYGTKIRLTMFKIPWDVSTTWTFWIGAKQVLVILQKAFWKDMCTVGGFTCKHKIYKLEEGKVLWYNQLNVFLFERFSPVARTFLYVSARTSAFFLYKIWLPLSIRAWISPFCISFTISASKALHDRRKITV